MTSRRGAPSCEEHRSSSIYDDPLRWELLRNHMVRMLPLTLDEMADGALTPVELTRNTSTAQERLMAIDVVGFQDRFEAFCADGPALRLGPGTTDLHEPHQPTPITRAPRRIADDNALDVQLYAEAARALHQGRRGRRP